MPNPSPTNKNNYSVPVTPDKSGPFQPNTDNQSVLFFYWLLALLSLGAMFLSYIIRTAQKNRELIKEVTEIGRGEPSEENLILTLRKAGFPTPSLFHDLYVPTRNNNFSQIDLVMVTSVGLLVFEVKDYSGWIFGNGRQQHWTQVLNYGKAKYRFYNPVIQNNNHLVQLKRYVQTEVPCFSIIVFFGNCELKDIIFIPQNTFIIKSHNVLEVINNILSTQKETMISKNIFDLLHQATAYGRNPSIRTQHIHHINDMLGKDRIFR